MEGEALELMQARHRKEQRDLQNRITSKKKNATKKTRKGVSDECAELERNLKSQQEEELRMLNGGENGEGEPDEADEDGHAATNGIAEKLRDTPLSDGTISQPEAPASLTATTAQSSEGGGGEGGGAGKKRNRHKERLARRAAEQEAASARAEEEAASMTDHRGRERTSMAREFAAHGLVEHEIRPDGHCLFSAVADQLQQHGMPITATSATAPGTPPYKAVRQAAAGHMAAHEDDFAPFLGEQDAAAAAEGGPVTGFGDYVARIRDTALWGGQLELRALADVYGVEIRVVQDGRIDTIQPAGGGGGDGDGGDAKTIWLAYYRHGYGLGEHYNSLRKAKP